MRSPGHHPVTSPTSRRSRLANLLRAAVLAVALSAGGHASPAAAAPTPPTHPAETTTAPAVQPAAAAQHITLPSGRTYWLTPGAGILIVGLPGTDNSAGTLNTQFWSQPGGWETHAQAHGYTLALAEQVGGQWNVGGGWPSSGQNDMQYLLDLVDDVEQRVTVDTSRVFIAGFSAGGAMAWTAVTLHPEVFAACAMASGWAGVRGATPIDCWHIHGTGDTGVPIRGGVGIFNYAFPPAADEARLAPRGSRVVLYPTTGGHAVPGWMADEVLTFCTTDRARP